ncbi:hypothetical protein NL676_005279 [Syzygium grande]|nr:hypothetical protein NL676_005279 [Syzygium grande]
MVAIIAVLLWFHDALLAGESTGFGTGSVLNPVKSPSELLMLSLHRGHSKKPAGKEFMGAPTMTEEGHQWYGRCMGTPDLPTVPSVESTTEL